MNRFGEKEGSVFGRIYLQIAWKDCVYGVLEHHEGGGNFGKIGGAIQKESNLENERKVEETKLS